MAERMKATVVASLPWEDVESSNVARVAWMSAARSQVNGAGDGYFGDAHPWHGETPQDNSKRTFWRCGACSAGFVHLYDEQPSIFAAMASAEIPTGPCPATTTGYLYVEFHGSTGRIYRYAGVRKEQHAELLEADSIGGYLNAEVKGAHEYERVEVEP